MFRPRPANVQATPFRWRTEAGRNTFAPAILVTQGAVRITVLLDDYPDLVAQIESSAHLLGAELPQDELQRDQRLAAYESAYADAQKEIERLRNAYDTLLIRTTPEMSEDE